MMSKPLNAAQLAVVDNHFANNGKDKLSRMWIDAKQSSVYNPKTARLHVHKHDRRMSGKQELVFDSAQGQATSLTSHSLKLWDRRRHASAREYARIQGFPEWFIPPKTLVTNLFGNAVAVPCATHACQSVGSGVRHPTTLLDLCAGIGGFHIAALCAFPLIKCVGFCEIKPAAVRCYKENFPDSVSLGNILDVEVWPRAELLTAGFPCQPFSRSCDIKLRATHTDRYFFRHVFEAIDVVRPRMVVLENVRALMCESGHAQLEAIMECFRTRGFATEYRVLDASSFALPQQRFRIYIIARRQDAADPQLSISPPPHHKSTVLGDIMEEY